MSLPNGVGVHVFAGGFTRGVRQVLPVVGQLEIHNFGRETVESMGLPFMNSEKWQDWQDYRETWKDCSFCYGNPRCTAFSSYSAGHGADVRGPKAAPTQDIWDLCRFGVKAGMELIAFESVQQAYTVGKQLLNMLRDQLFVPNNYRIAHIFVNTAAEGNAQNRRRYFCVAYKNHRNFNVVPPDLAKYRTVVRDVLAHDIFKTTKVNETRVCGHGHSNYDYGSYTRLNSDDAAVVPHMIQGDSLTSLARRDPENWARMKLELAGKVDTGIGTLLEAIRNAKSDGGPTD